MDPPIARATGAIAGLSPNGPQILEQDWHGSRDNWFDAFQNYLSIKKANIRAPIVPKRKYDEVLQHELLVKTQSWKKDSGRVFNPYYLDHSVSQSKCRGCKSIVQAYNKKPI